MNPKGNDGCLPESVGYETVEQTLCIGLDIAWHGGSKSNRDSQYDFIIAALISKEVSDVTVQCTRLKLIDRDPQAEQTSKAIQDIIANLVNEPTRIVLAIDAPLQAREHQLAAGRQKSLRACERQLSDGRQSLDVAAGGCKGWHPNIQPGYPLAPRVQNLLVAINKGCGLCPWTPTIAEDPRLAIECFPAEAIWAANRLGMFPLGVSVSDVKAYKKQKGTQLTRDEVERLVEIILLDGFKSICGNSSVWPKVVKHVQDWMLADSGWQKEGFYRGGKLLDDVVDSTICLATALSYALNHAHVWYDPNHPEDGHIIGPGRFLAT